MFISFVLGTLAAIAGIYFHKTCVSFEEMYLDKLSDNGVMGLRFIVGIAIMIVCYSWGKYFGNSLMISFAIGFIIDMIF